MTTPLSKATVEIDANIDPLKEGVSDAKAEVESLGDAVEQTSGKTKQGIGSAASSFRSMAGEITGTIGAATGLLAVFGLLTGAITKLIELRKKDTESAKEMVQQYGDLKRAVADAFGDLTEVEQAQRTFEDLNKSIVEAINATDNPKQKRLLLDQLDEAFIRKNEEIARIERENARTQQRERSQANFEDRRQQLETARQVEDAIKKIGEANLPDRDRIVAQYESIYADVASVIQGSLLTQSQVDEYLAMLKAATDEAEAYALRKHDERMAEEERREVEKNARIVKKAADDWKRGMDRAAQSLFSSTGTSAGFGGFSGLVDAARDVADAIRGGHGGRR